MARADGYRVGRLRQRRRRRLQTWQLVFLVVFAVAVAFGAVFGAVRLADWILGPKEEAHKDGYLALVVVGKGETGRQPSVYLAMRDAATKTTTLFTVPRDLLLEAPGGEYVYAGDMVGTDLKGDLERLLDAKIDLSYQLPYKALQQLAGRDEVRAELASTATVKVDGAQKGFKGKVDIPASEIPVLLSAEGKSGSDESAMQDAVTRAVFDATALRPQQARGRTVDGVVTGARGGQKEYLREVLQALTNGQGVVERIPSNGETAMGQFAFRPDPERIMALITRRAPGFNAPYTVVVRNGSGEVGVGEAAAKRIASLDVNLPPVANASSFDYKRTQILAGAKALGVAQEVRAILGHGVVLDGAGLDPSTVMVIVGKDVSAKDLQE